MSRGESTVSEPTGSGEGVSVELHPVRLFRAAQGDRALEAAIVLLSHAGVLDHLHCCVTVDGQRNLAWIDWNAALSIAQRLSDQERAVVHLAAALAEHAGTTLTTNPRSLTLALRHLGA